jgi:hypothetical protein
MNRPFQFSHRNKLHLQRISRNWETSSKCFYFPEVLSD